MFHTIAHKSGGFVQISIVNGKETIRAWNSYKQIGDTYKTVPAAKAALTKEWKETMAYHAAEHHKRCFG